MLRLKTLRHSYGNKHALKDINLCFERPAIVGLLGHNGCGKSTLLKILGASLACQSGCINYFGHNALDSTGFIERALRRKIGVLFQSSSSDLNLSARENLIFYARLMGISKATEVFSVEQCLKQANLEERAYEILKTYSQGMRRRLELYRTFMHKPKILLLDEPSEGLDFAETARFLAFLKSYVKSEKALVIMATHRAEELEHCDEIVMMNQGLIIAKQRPEELLASCDYLRVEVELQTGASAWQAPGFKKAPAYPSRLQAQVPPSDLEALLSSPIMHSSALKSVRWQRLQLADIYEARRQGEACEQ